MQFKAILFKSWLFLFLILFEKLVTNIWIEYSCSVNSHHWIMAKNTEYHDGLSNWQSKHVLKEPANQGHWDKRKVLTMTNVCRIL